MTETWKWTISVLSTIGSAMALVSLLKRGFNIDLTGIPSLIHAEYERFREFVFFVVPFRLPGWLKDSIVGYVMVAAALQRSERRMQEEWLATGGRRATPQQIQANTVSTAKSVILAALWPYALLVGFFGVFTVPKERRTWRGFLIFAGTLGIIVLAAVFFFGWNYLSK